MYRLHLMIALAATAVLALGGCGDPDEENPDDEICDNSVDDDGDDDIDCDDSDCDGDPSCVEPSEVCTNDRDDDNDGDIDCDDSDCDDDPACQADEEICDNGDDDDGDGDVDCDDSDCFGAGCPEICDNDEDDDGDGDTDCFDSDCIGDAACPEICDNSADDDGDGDVDCADSDCFGAGCPEVCDGGDDDDGDGLTDCDDEDCAADAACFESDCADDGDSDGDGLTDCMDPDCDVSADCAELCNGLDDDGDGLVDELPSDATIGDPCYDGPAAAAGVGQCDEGEIGCFGGTLLCIGWIAPLEVELCDGLDNDCDGVTPTEEFSGDACSTVIRPGDPSAIEFMTEVRDVDVHINLDTTGSMGGALSTLQTTLSTTIVPAVRAMLPTSEFGVSTFDDFPLGGFGSPSTDLPFELHERITSSVPVVQSALEAISLHSGNDGPESGIESLYQIAMGTGTGWPPGDVETEICGNSSDDDGDSYIDCVDPDCATDSACTAWPVEVCAGGGDEDGDSYIDCNDPDCVSDYRCSSGISCPSPVEPGLRAVTPGHIATGEWDAYSISLVAGETLIVDIDAYEAGSPLDSYLYLYDQADGTELDSDDDTCSYDSHIEYYADVAIDLVVVVAGYSSSSSGWYALHATLDEVELLGDAATCTALEVGDDPFATGTYDSALAVPLVDADTVYPLTDAAACTADCDAVLDAGAADWYGAFCDGPPTLATCGDTFLDADEECDDGNTVSGDGCSFACRTEPPAPGCGNGTIDPGEECDDGNTTAGDGCSDACVIEPGCGNGLAENGEECDDGNITAGDGCSATCTIESVCGDGALTPGEECDDGNTTAGDGCDGTCVLEPACGNAKLEGTEECDDGNTTAGDGCDGTCLIELMGTGSFDWAAGFDPGLGHGTLGGVGFRDSALPVIVHITDAVSHECTDYTTYDASIDAHCSAETFTALNAMGARVLPVATYTGSATSLLDPLGMAYGTGSVVPLCAFDGSAARTSGVCAAGQCCTGVSGAGVAPDTAGECPLVFGITGSGTGLDTSIVNSIDALTQFVTYDLTVALRDDTADAVDALCFIDFIEIIDSLGPTGSCAITPVPADLDGDTYNETLTDATPRTRVTYRVHAVNEDINDLDGDGDITEACAGSGSYGIFVDMIAEAGTVVGTRLLTIEVP